MANQQNRLNDLMRDLESLLTDMQGKVMGFHGKRQKNQPILHMDIGEVEHMIKLCFEDCENLRKELDTLTQR